MLANGGGNEEGREEEIEAETTRVLCCGLHTVDDRASAQTTLGG